MRLTGTVGEFHAEHGWGMSDAPADRMPELAPEAVHGAQCCP
ncbi:hypothetical protein [Micromonospora psammae]